MALALDPLSLMPILTEDDVIIRKNSDFAYNPQDKRPHSEKSIDTLLSVTSADRDGFIASQKGWTLSSLKTLLTLENRTLEEYNTFLYVSLAINLSCLAGESWETYCSSSASNADSPETLLASFAIAAMITTIISLVKLLLNPTPNWSLSTCIVVIVEEVILLLQSIYLAKKGFLNNVHISLSIVIQIVQLITVLTLYRFWQFLMYNYDPNNNTQSLGGRSRSTSARHSNISFTQRLSDALGLTDGIAEDENNNLDIITENTIHKSLAENSMLV